MLSSLRLFLLLCVFRILNTFVIQSYFDPDEFWQTMEPAYCAVFRPDQGLDCPGFTWEWKRRPPVPTPQVQRYFLASSIRELIEASLLGPARTYLSVLPVHIYFRALRTWHFDTTWMIARGPMILYAVTVAAPTDWAVWYCAHTLYSSSTVASLPAWSLLASLTAWFNAFSMVRTFANAQEAMLLMFALTLVSSELLGRRSTPQTTTMTTKAMSSRMWRARIAFLLGGMSVSIRGTSAAAFVPMGILLAWQEKSWSKRISYLFSVCALFGLAGIGVALLVDTWFFGFPTLPFLGNFHFNVILDHASLFGAHPWHWYLTAGIPAITGILLPLVIVDWFAVWSEGRRNLWIIVVVYTLAMSGNDHKEFRYILPLLPIFCLLAGERLQQLLGQKSSRITRTMGFAVLVIANLIATLYLGLFHQSGPITVNREIVRLARQKIGQVGQHTIRNEFRVDYLTGSCHSTPLLSALHYPPLEFKTKALDCSPSCRADPVAVCETEAFHQDPQGYLQRFYPQICRRADATDEDGDTVHQTVCHWEEDGANHPSFVVTMSSYVEAMQSLLEAMGLYEVGRYPHHIDGAMVGGYVLGNDSRNSSTKYRFSSSFEVSVEDVVLFAQR